MFAPTTLRIRRFSQIAILLLAVGLVANCAAVDTNSIYVDDGDNLILTQGESTSIFNLEGLNGGTGFVSDPGTVGAFVDATNTFLSGSSWILLNTGMNGVPAGTCVPPIL